MVVIGFGKSGSSPLERKQPDNVQTNATSNGTGNEE